MSVKEIFSKCGKLFSQKDSGPGLKTQTSNQHKLLAKTRNNLIHADLSTILCPNKGRVCNHEYKVYI